MTQYHVQKVFGEAGGDGVRKELQQLHMTRCIGQEGWPAFLTSTP